MMLILHILGSMANRICWKCLNFLLFGIFLITPNKSDPRPKVSQKPNINSANSDTGKSVPVSRLSL